MALVGIPAETAWEWQWQARVERMVGYGRIAAALVASLDLWVHPAPGLAAVCTALWAFVAVDGWVRARAEEIAVRYRWGAAAVDVALVGGLILATGPESGSFRALCYPLALAVALRLPPAAAVGGLAACLVASFWPAPDAVAAVSLALLGWLAVAACSLLRQHARLGLRDPLTGCFSRTYALFVLEHELRAAHLPLSVAFVDLDGYKAVNDRLGHRAGDAVLAQAARCLQTHVRIEDVVARYGGDEFLLVLRGADAPAARAVALRAQAALAELAPGPDLTMTASFGIATATSPEEPSRLVGEADRRLYAAKQTRNAIVAD